MVEQQQISPRGTDVALFVDWENFKISLAAGNRNPNLSSLKEEVAEHGRMVVAKAYADWVTRAPELKGASQFTNDPPSLYAAGIEPVFVPTRSPSPQASSANGVRTPRIKNSVDVKMTADCIECAHYYPNINTFVLVSGDSDFIHVVNSLRSMGKRVILIGVSWSTSRHLADQVDALVLYDVDVDPVMPAVLPQAARQQPDPIPPAAPARADLPEIIRAIEEIIRDERSAGGNPLLTSIKQRLMRRYPSFDEKKLGFSGFKKLMARAAEEGNIKLITAGLVDWAIMANEDIPEGASEEDPEFVSARPARRRGGRRHAREVNAWAAAESMPTTAADAETEAEAEAVAEPLPGLLDAAAADEDTADAAGEPSEIAAAISAYVEAAERETAAPPPALADEPEPMRPVFGDDAALAADLQAALAEVNIPLEGDDPRALERLSDLVVMADTLEHQAGVSHVAFNFLAAQIGQALEQGLEAGAAEIAHRWGDSHSSTFVRKLLRGLRDGGLFQVGAYNWRDAETGQQKRRSTFNLNRDNPLVARMLAARQQPTPPASSANPPEPAALDDTPEPEPTIAEPEYAAAPEPENLAATDDEETDDGESDDGESDGADGEETDYAPSPETDYGDDAQPANLRDPAAEGSFISRLLRPGRRP